MAQILFENEKLTPGSKGIGFGVGMERLPALFASHGVKITATDQDFQTCKSKQWDNEQLAHNVNSLNREKICKPQTFKENVSFKREDMRKLSKSVTNRSYDFLWSNCALGHLGSIDNSLEFIEKSLTCLKPGGIAVHTTEFNAISDSETLNNTDTVFFRPSDFLKLGLHLAKQGYDVSPLELRLFKTNEDLGYTLKPTLGNDQSKILFCGYLATQVVLIIRKPEQPPTATARVLKAISLRANYVQNLKHQYAFRNKTPIAALLKADRGARRTKAADTNITPLSQNIKITLKPGETKEVRVGYDNLSSSGLFNLYYTFKDTNPLALSTSTPIDRNSKFASASWRLKNRPLIAFYPDKRANKSIEYIPPKSEFYLGFELSAGNKKPGVYHESFILIKEFDNQIPTTEITLEVTVKKK